jgi:hypothetical protein
MHASTRLIMDRRIPSEMAGQLRIVLTDIRNAMVKCLSFNRSYIPKRFFSVPTGKNSENSNLGSVEACSGPFSTCLSVMIGVAEIISRSAAKMCRSTVMHSFGHNSQMFPDTCWYGRCLFWYVEHAANVCPHLSVTLCIYIHTYLHTYIYTHTYTPH